MNQWLSIRCPIMATCFGSLRNLNTLMSDRNERIMAATVQAYSKFTDFDISLFRSGKNFKLYEKFGSHELVHNETSGGCFSVWAPNATAVAVGCNFNGWNRESHLLWSAWGSAVIM